MTKKYSTKLDYTDYNVQSSIFLLVIDHFIRIRDQRLTSN